MKVKNKFVDKIRSNLRKYFLSLKPCRGKVWFEKNDTSLHAYRQLEKGINKNTKILNRTRLNIIVIIIPSKIILTTSIFYFFQESKISNLLISSGFCLRFKFLLKEKAFLLIPYLKQRLLNCLLNSFYM